MNHLIHIGFARCGSTYLQEWFRRNTQLHVNNVALAGFADAVDICRTAAEPQKSDFKYYVTSCEGLSLPFYGIGRDMVDLLDKAYSSPTPFPIAQRRVCQILADLFPSAKILIVTRGFKTVMLSLYNQYVRMGYQPTLAEMCHNFVECGAADYDYAIELYQSAFGKENILIVPFEILREGEASFTRLLEERLCLDHEEIVMGKINESLTPLELHWCRTIFRTFGRLKPILGDARYRKLHNQLTMSSLSGKLNGVLAACRSMTPTKRIEAPIVPDDALEMCRGKASHLLELPLYAPYLKDYLLD